MNLNIFDNENLCLHVLSMPVWVYSECLAKVKVKVQIVLAKS